MAECPKCDGEGWLWRHELPDPHYEPCDVGADDTRYTCPYCVGTGDAAAEIDRLRVEVEALKQKIRITNGMYHNDEAELVRLRVMVAIYDEALHAIIDAGDSDDDSMGNNPVVIAQSAIKQCDALRGEGERC